ncbi:MAG TPA: ABC transporter permease subunit [Jatrophihabitantaceae bacterium]
MTATGFEAAASAPGAARAPIDPEIRPGRRRRSSGRVARWVILLICGIYFILPLVATISFTLQNPRGGVSFDAYRQIFSTPATGQVGFTTALLYSLGIAAITIIVTIALMLPTQLLLHLRYTKVRGVVEVITLLPLVFPPVVLVVGVSDVYTWSSNNESSFLFSILRDIRQSTPPFLLAFLYVILAMPFVYRALDAGIRAVDVRTLVEAARNLGASWPRLVITVLMPCLRTAIVNGAFLCFALVMGEFTISSILLYTKPFPVWLYQLPTNSGQVQAAVSVFSLVLVEVLLLIIGALNVRRSASQKG